jgi:hypothetical protein
MNILEFFPLYYINNLEKEYFVIMSSAFKRLSPLFNRILIKKFEVPTKTTSGIILSEGTDKT